MFVKVLLVLVLLTIIYTLISSFWFLVRDKGEGTRAVRRLTWRIGLSVLLFALLYLAFLAGWIKPGSGNPVQYPSAATAEQEPGD
jgi:cytochrome bd-type quinol oxidase subunit 2